jgi:hypothetical protein
MTMKKCLLLCLIVLATLLPALAQGTSVTHTPTHLDACQFTASSSSSAATITITPGSGFVYICGISVQNCAGSSAVSAANPTTLTTTNISSTPSWLLGSGTTAGGCVQTFSENYGPGGLKSASAGVNVTFVLPTFATNQTISVKVFYNLAPQ